MTGITPLSQSLLPLPLPLPSAPGGRRDWAGLADCGHALGLAALRAGQHATSGSSSCPRSRVRKRSSRNCAISLSGHPRIALFPDTEVLPYDTFSPHQDLISRRLTVLRDVAAGRIDTLLVAASTLLPRLPPVRYIGGYSVVPGRRPDAAARTAAPAARNCRLPAGLPGAGARRFRGPRVPCSISTPWARRLPVRVDFLDDEIDSLRQFDPDSQLSGHALESLETLPAREMPVDAAGIKQFRQAYRRRFEGNPARAPSSIAKCPKGGCRVAWRTTCRCSLKALRCSGTTCPRDRLTITLGDPEAPAHAGLAADQRAVPGLPGRLRAARAGARTNSTARRPNTWRASPVLHCWSWIPARRIPLASEERAATAGLATAPASCCLTRAPMNRRTGCGISFATSPAACCSRPNRPGAARCSLTCCARKPCRPPRPAAGKTSWLQPRPAMVCIAPLEPGPAAARLPASRSSRNGSSTASGRAAGAVNAGSAIRSRS